MVSYAKNLMRAIEAEGRRRLSRIKIERFVNGLLALLRIRRRVQLTKD